MAELEDYSGVELKDVGFEIFSKDFLFRILHEWADNYVNLSQNWYKSCEERLGTEAANNCMMAVWQIIAEVTAPQFAKMLNQVEMESSDSGEKGDWFGPLKVLKVNDFTKDSLIKVMEVFYIEHVRMAGCWWNLMTQRAGDEVACDCQLEVWVNTSKIALPKMAKALNIEVNDLVDAFKVQRCVDGGCFTGLFQQEYEIKSRNHVIYHMSRCVGLEWMEKNTPHRTQWLCHVFEPAMWKAYIGSLLPAVEITALKLPPHKSPDESPVCLWEFKLPGKGAHSGKGGLRHTA